MLRFQNDILSFGPALYWYNYMKYHEKYEELLVQLHEISWKKLKNYWYNYMKYHEKYEE